MRLERALLGKTLIIAFAAALGAAGALYGQFSQYTQPGTPTPGGGNVTRQDLEDAVAAARWHLGGLRVDPWLALRNVSWVDNPSGQPDGATGLGVRRQRRGRRRPAGLPAHRPGRHLGGLRPARVRLVGQAERPQPAQRPLRRRRLRLLQPALVPGLRNPGRAARHHHLRVPGAGQLPPHRRLGGRAPSGSASRPACSPRSRAPAPRTSWTRPSARADPSSSCSTGTSAGCAPA